MGDRDLRIPRNWMDNRVGVQGLRYDQASSNLKKNVHKKATRGSNQQNMPRCQMPRKCKWINMTFKVFHYLVCTSLCNFLSLPIFTPLLLTLLSSMEESDFSFSFCVCCSSCLKCSPHPVSPSSWVLYTWPLTPRVVCLPLSSTISARAHIHCILIVL